MGNEDQGLSRRAAAACSSIMFIPQVAGDSLNVGHAAAICVDALSAGLRQAMVTAPQARVSLV